jgi:tetratricopeptide (TPR) repeat protein/2-polyprenyl-3-methyl-5-hydroxy-6-metoxy-1,4-benzoquinol methylase
MTVTDPSPTDSITIDQALQQAITHHQAGDLQAAEQLYRAILQTQPNHPDANHNLGVLAVQVQLPAVALPHFKSALESNPAHDQYWLSYIDALIQTDQQTAAQQVLIQGRERGLQGKAVEALAERLYSMAHKYIPSAEEPPLEEIEQLVTLFNQCRYTEAETIARKMTERFPQHGFGWKALGAVLKSQGLTKESLEPMQKATILAPLDAMAHSNLGSSLRDLGRLDESEASCRRALEIKPDYVEAHNNLGNALRDLGRLDESEASYRRALKIKPDYVEAHNNLGNALRDLGRLDESEASCRRALEIKPDYVEAHNNLGNALRDLGRLDESEASYRRALKIKPDYAEAYSNLASLFNEQGKWLMALSAVKQSLRIKETEEAKSLFIISAKHLSFTQDDNQIRIYLVRALTEPWGRPSDLVKVGTSLIKLNIDIQECIALATNAWPMRLSSQELYVANSLATLADDPLLCTLLHSVPICDIEMERFLTMVRYAMLEEAIGMTALDDAVGTTMSFYSALAHQCFINEYVFSYTSEEIKKASGLRDSLVAALEAKNQVPALWIVAVAAYFPLNTLPLAARLLDTEWPEEIASMLLQQVREPEEELQLRDTIPQLTGIDDEMSLLVQNQYEENPYPRWVKIASNYKPKPIDVALRRMFPLNDFQPLGKLDNPNILIAGCGTGQHSITTKQEILGAQILAVDLSMGSLSYAKRKSLELGLTSIEYAQADILKLGSLDRKFDIIETVGVLHHLSNPWVGWQVLLSLLRPNGFMRLGFYSEIARRNIVKTRGFISDRGYGSTANEIRQCRQYLLDLDIVEHLGDTTHSSDFFSISACRDLLFHVQEHRMTLTGIEKFLREQNLAFLGFDIDPSVLRAYKQRFPDDSAATNLSQWQIFEKDNPDTFIGMYQFWIQKEGTRDIHAMKHANCS